MARDPSPTQAMTRTALDKAIEFEAAERNAELPGDTPPIGNGKTTKTKVKQTKADTAETKAPRTKHTYATEDDIFEWLELVAIGRKLDKSDLVNNALWQYLPTTLKIGGALLTRPTRRKQTETTETTAGDHGSNGQGG